MGPQSDGSLYSLRRRGSTTRLERAAASIRIEKDMDPSREGDVETLRDEHDTHQHTGAPLTGLGIRVGSRPDQRAKSFLSLRDDDDEEEEAGGDGHEQTRASVEVDRTSDKDSDTASITSTGADLDLTPLVNAFPSPPTPSSLASLVQLDEAKFPSIRVDGRHLPQLHHQPSISTISSEFTLASTLSSTSSIETPSPQTPTTSDMTSLAFAVPRPNAAAIRRVRSFAKPVSVYFSPDRPPTLPLPSLPPAGASAPTSPAPDGHSPSESTGSKPSPLMPYGFYAPSYGRSPRPPVEPPSAPPPDRPLPSLPRAEEQAPRDSRLVQFPTASTTLEVCSEPARTPRPPCSELESFSTGPSFSSPRRQSLQEVERGRSRSHESDSSTPTIKSPNTTAAADAPAVARKNPVRSRVESTSSVASLDLSQISRHLNQLATDGNIQESTDAAGDTKPNEPVREVQVEGEQEKKTDKELERERVRRLITRVSSVIEMRKLSTASNTSSATSSILGGAGSARGERTGYKAYKLARKPSLSPSNSFGSFARGGRDHSSPGQHQQTDRSRTSSYDSDSDSSASEELFDLSFDTSVTSSAASSQLLSPCSITSSGRSSSYVRRSQVPPRWAGRRKSSATTIEEDEGEEDRLKPFAVHSYESLDRDAEDDGEEEERLEESIDTFESPRRVLRAVASNESFRPRLQSIQSPAAGTKKGRTLRAVSSVPVLRGPTSTSTYTASPLGSTSPEPTTSTPTRLKPLITSSPPHVRRSFIPPAPSSSSRIPLSGSSRYSLSPSTFPQPPQFSDPFSSSSTSPTLSPRPSISTLRKSSLPVPSSSSSIVPPTNLRRPSAPASYHTTVGPHRRKPSLATLSYHHSSPPSNVDRAVSPTSQAARPSIPSSFGSRIAQPSLAHLR